MSWCDEKWLYSFRSIASDFFGRPCLQRHRPLSTSRFSFISALLSLQFPSRVIDPFAARRPTWSKGRLGCTCSFQESMNTVARSRYLETTWIMDSLGIPGNLGDSGKLQLRPEMNRRNWLGMCIWLYGYVWFVLSTSGLESVCTFVRLSVFLCLCSSLQSTR